MATAAIANMGAPGVRAPIMEEYRDNLNMKILCPDCKEDPPNLIEEFSSGDMVCASCGLVLGDRIVDTRSEWRTFSNDDSTNDDPSRVGDNANPLLNGSQLQTTIAFGDGGRSRDLHRAQNKSTHDKATKELLLAYKEIGNIADNMAIPKNVSDFAKHLYKIVDDARAFKGKSLPVLSAGCIFIACRQCKVPRSFKEIYAMTNVQKKDIGRIFKALEKFLALHGADKMTPGGLTNGVASYSGTQATKAEDLCVRYCSRLDLPMSCTTLSGRLAREMEEKQTLAGRSPLSAAAACIYMVSYLLGYGKTAKEISMVAGVSDGTIRTAYRLLYNARNDLIKDEWLQNPKDPKGKPIGDMKNLPPS